MGLSFFIRSAQLRGEILAFRGTLVRAEQNRNGDEIDAEGVQEIAATLPHKAITLEHEPAAIVGHWTDANVAQNAVDAEGMIYAGRFAEVAKGVMENKYQLSVEAKADKAVCKVCNGEFESPNDYCEHLIVGKDTGYYPKGRKLKNCVALGGALVRKGAGTMTTIDPMSIRMVATDLTPQEYEPFGVEETLKALVMGEHIPQKEREEMAEEDFAGPHRSFPIRNQQDVHDAARLIGHADDSEAVKSAIIRIAKKKGFSLPESWQASDTKVKAEGGDANMFKCMKCGTEFEDTSAFEAHVREEEAASRLTIEAKLSVLESSLTTKDEELTGLKAKLDELTLEQGMQRIATRLTELTPVLGADLSDEQKQVYAKMDDDTFSTVFAALKAQPHVKAPNETKGALKLPFSKPNDVKPSGWDVFSKVM